MTQTWTSQVMYFVECPSMGFVWWVLMVRFQLCRNAMVVSLFSSHASVSGYAWIYPIVDDYLVRWGQPGFVPIKLHIFFCHLISILGERIFTIIIFSVQFNVDFIMFQIWPVGGTIIWLWHAFDLCSLFLEHFFGFWHNSVFNVLSLTWPWNHPFSEKVMALFHTDHYSEAEICILDRSVLLDKPCSYWFFQGR